MSLLVAMIGMGTASAGPTISSDQAKKIALGRVFGKVMHEKLVKGKKDGKKNIAHDHYYVKIAPKENAKSGWKRVDIDAESGVILEIKDVKAKTYD